MHRTVEVGTLNSKFAEVNGTKPKSLRRSREFSLRTQNNQARNATLLGSQFVYIGVLSDDFAAVDVREELCYHSRPEKANSDGRFLDINMLLKNFVRMVDRPQKR